MSESPNDPYNSEQADGQVSETEALGGGEATTTGADAIPVELDGDDEAGTSISADDPA